MDRHGEVRIGRRVVSFLITPRKGRRWQSPIETEPVLFPESRRLTRPLGHRRVSSLDIQANLYAELTQYGGYRGTIQRVHNRRVGGVFQVRRNLRRFISG